MGRADEKSRVLCEKGAPLTESIQVRLYSNLNECLS